MRPVRRALCQSNSLAVRSGPDRPDLRRAVAALIAGGFRRASPAASTTAFPVSNELPDHDPARLRRRLLEELHRGPDARATAALEHLCRSLVDTLVADVDLIDLLDLLTDHAADVSGADAVGLVLANARSRLQSVAASKDAGEALAGQLQVALNSRIVIEQAKGALSRIEGVSVDEAFVIMRQRARSSRTRLVDVATKILER